MCEEIKSAGIDIGTSTTQLIFSKMIMKDVSGFGCIPRTEIISKEIIYRSNIYFTPLISLDVIDGEKVCEIIKKEYELAGISPKDLTTGAIIITGESARKKNAKQLTESLAKIAGDFVVATAGPDLESILAGKGAGAAALSKKTGKIVANMDIGGGTTNICYFKDGEVLDTACFNIGGRLVKWKDDCIIYVAEVVKKLAAKYNLDIKEGEKPQRNELKRLCSLFAMILAQTVGLCDKTEDSMICQHNRCITASEQPQILTFSGGVAACMDENYEDFQYQDIGVLLADAIKENIHFRKIRQNHALETMRATVIGAGNYTLDISGSTIEYTETKFPLSSLPIGKIHLEKEEDISKIPEEFRKMREYFDLDNTDQMVIAMKGIPCPSFMQIQRMAEIIMKQYDQNFSPDVKLILIVEADIGKALGQALKRVNHKKRVIICIDNICCNSGDYIDIGIPMAAGKVIPVIVKTLVFQENGESKAVR